MVNNLTFGCLTFIARVELMRQSARTDLNDDTAVEGIKTSDVELPNSVFLRTLFSYVINNYFHVSPHSGMDLHIKFRVDSPRQWFKVKVSDVIYGREEDGYHSAIPTDIIVDEIMKYINSMCKIAIDEIVKLQCTPDGDIGDGSTLAKDYKRYDQLTEEEKANLIDLDCYFCSVQNVYFDEYHDKLHIHMHNYDVDCEIFLSI